jgi:hypothetical protein
VFDPSRNFEYEYEHRFIAQFSVIDYRDRQVVSNYHGRDYNRYCIAPSIGWSAIRLLDPAPNEVAD